VHRMPIFRVGKRRMEPDPASSSRNIGVDMESLDACQYHESRFALEAISSRPRALVDSLEAQKSKNV